jgi:plastocyanin
MPRPPHAVLALALALSAAAPLDAQARRRTPTPRATVHEVVLRHVDAAEADEDLYLFVPQETTARPGDRIRFTVESGGPHSVVIAADSLDRSTAEAWNQALPRRVGPRTSPLLVAPGDTYELTVPRVPPGRYRYYCLPHRAYRMDGVIVVAGE